MSGNGCGCVYCWLWHCSTPPVGSESEAEVRTQLGQIFRTDTASWTLVTRQVSSAAWPAVRPPLLSGRDVELGDGLFVAGDHRDSPSIQGALASGWRTAGAVLDELRAT